MSEQVGLKAKIGQMIMVGFDGTELHPSDTIIKAITQSGIGGVVLFDYNFQTKLYKRNIQSPSQVKKLTEVLQSWATVARIPRLLIGIDYEGGQVNRLKAEYGFPKLPSAAEIGQMDEDQASKYANQMAETLQSVGINLNFAPVVDINVNPLNPIIGKLGRSYSNDSERVMTYARLIADALKAHGILSVYKHFPGHGSSSKDSHLGFVDVTKTWQANELNPYALPAAPMVMTSHVVHYELDPLGYPASLSYAMTTKLLREKLYFHGVVVTDDLQMKAITDNFSTEVAVRLAINAGADMLVFGNQLAAEQNAEMLIELIYKEIREGHIKLARIEEAYQRIIAIKSFL